MESRKNSLKGKSLIIILSILLIAGLILRMIPLYNQTLFEPDVFFHYAVMQRAVSDNYSIPKYFSLSNNAFLVEPHGLYYMVLLPYYPVSGFVGLYDFMRIVPLIYFVLLFLVFYYFTGFISKESGFRIIAVFLLAITLSGIIRTMATEYRGDGFIGLFLLLSMALMLKAYFEKKMAYMIPSVIVLSINNAVWNGGVFAFAVYSFSVFLLIIHNFMEGNRENLQFLSLICISLLLFAALFWLFNAYNVIIQQPVSFIQYLFAVLGLIATSFAALFSMNIRKKTKRIIIYAMVALASILAIGFGINYNWTDFYLYFQNYGGYGSAIYGQSELYPQTIYGILYYNGILSLFAPAYWPVFLSALLPLGFKFVAFIGIILAFLFYLKMSKEKEAMIVVLSYFSIAAFLYFYALRWSILLSIPGILVVAHALNWLIARYGRSGIKILLIRSLIFLNLILAINAAYVYGLSLNVNPQYLSALSWIKGNTLPNSTIITYWNDGSEVAGWANRSATQTSVANQNTDSTYTKWLLSQNRSVQQIKSLGNYVLVRYYMNDYRYFLCRDAGLDCTATLSRYKDSNLYYLLYSDNTFNGLALVYGNNDTKFYRILK